MKYSLTIFQNTFDNKTHRTMTFDSWEKFVVLLSELYDKKGAKGGRNSSPLIRIERLGKVFKSILGKGISQLA